MPIFNKKKCALTEEEYLRSMCFASMWNSTKSNSLKVVELEYEGKRYGENCWYNGVMWLE